MGTATTTIHKRVDIKRNDTVKVMTGRDAGKEGRVLRVFPDEGKVLVEHVMTVKKHVRPNPQRNIKSVGFRLRTWRWSALPVARFESDTKSAATEKCASARSAGRRWINSC
jgi:hypothetical protein